MEDHEPETLLASEERKIGTVDESFYIIGIGASAGGLEAIEQLVTRIPPNFPHSFVIVQHISPDYKSLMAEILGRETSLPVVEVRDNQKVDPGHIYIIPPRANIVIQGTEFDSNYSPTGNEKSEFSGLRFSLISPPARPALNRPIDVFFQSLAEAVGDRSVAVILSGTGTDGSRGLRAIKDREGTVLVQEPKTASFDGMPRAAVATGIVDIVASPDSLVGELQRYFQMRESGIMNIDSVFLDTESKFDDLIDLVSEKSEIDFGQYKEPTLKRRIARRMALATCSTLDEYYEFARQNTSELNVLHREFLVGVTNFFRDLPAWKALEETCLAGLFEHGDKSEPVRVWSVGCSTGEEPFTVAMMLENFRQKHNIKRDFKIFATDVNPNAIAAARQGIYPESVREEIPSEYLDPHFLSYQSGTFIVSDEIRNRVIFAEHNIAEDAPYTRTNLITCRNLLIYLSPEVQAKVMTQFSYSLEQGGILLLGAAETPGQHGSMFEIVVNRARIYRNTRAIGVVRNRPNYQLEFPAPGILPRARRMAGFADAPTHEFNQLLISNLEETTSCICIVESTGKLIRSFGNHEYILHMPEGGFTPNILDLIDERLRSSLTLVLRETELDGQAKKEKIRMTGEGEIVAVDINCRKVTWESFPIAYAITFRTHREDQTAPARPPESFAKTEGEKAQQKYIEHLEGEVQSLQDMLSATAEDLGASNEELQATNEELIASNERLQANNEETQSINEELHTVNAENIEKITELEAATADINNLLGTAELGVLVLTDDLRVRRYSEGIQTYVDLEPGDIGRSVENFSFSFHPDAMARLLDDLRHVADTGQIHTREVQRKDGGWAFSRIRPYRDATGDLQGVVVSLVDITETKLLQEEVQVQRDRFENLLESEASGYWDWNIPTGTEYMSPSFKAMFGYEEDEIENLPESWQKLIHPDDLPRLRENFEAHVNSQGKIPYDNEVRYYHKNGSVVWVIRRGSVTEWTDDGKPLRMIGVHIDVTNLKKREDAVRRRADEVKRFAFIAAHDLLEPLLTIESSVGHLSRNIPDDAGPNIEIVKNFLRSSTARLRARIKGILTYSRLQDGTLELEPLNMNEIVKGCIEDLDQLIRDTGAEISVTEMPSALGSDSLIEQVIQNLLDNAIKFRSPDRPCKIAISATETSNGKIAFRIADNGIGIREEHREKVFELFRRLHTDDEYCGEGMGLTFCHQIVAMHGGDVTVETGLDGGAALIFTLDAA